MMDMSSIYTYGLYNILVDLMFNNEIQSWITVKTFTIY